MIKDLLMSQCSVSCLAILLMLDPFLGPLSVRDPAWWVVTVRWLSQASKPVPWSDDKVRTVAEMIIYFVHFETINIVLLWRHIRQSCVSCLISILGHCRSSVYLLSSFSCTITVLTDWQDIVRAKILSPMLANLVLFAGPVECGRS